LSRGCLIAAAALLLACLALVFVVCSFVEVSREPSDGRRMQDLLALPYLTHSPQKAEESLSGVVQHDRERASGGYNLYTSRTSPEVLLMDMEGHVVRRWISPQEREAVVEYAALFDDGDLLVINKFEDVVRLDPEGDAVWRREIPAHHDVWIEPDGSAWVVVRDVRRHNGLDVDFSALVRLDAEGEVDERWDAYDGLDNIRQRFDMTPLDPEIDQGGVATRLRRFVTRALGGKQEKLRDPFHLNTVTVLPETELGKRDARFREGNLLICYRNLDQIAMCGAGGTATSTGRTTRSCSRPAGSSSSTTAPFGSGLGSSSSIPRPGRSSGSTSPIRGSRSTPRREARRNGFPTATP
jgi:hypothetical protein